MHRCLLCEGSEIDSIDCLSGKELRDLWAEVGRSFDNDAFGLITADYRVHLWKCKRCGFQFFDPELAGTETFYRQLRDEDYFASERPEFVRTLQWANDHGLEKLLDVGCGTGAFLDLAQRQGLTTHGLELNKAAAQEARGKSHIIFNELLHELNPTEFTERYDLITLFQVLEHVASPAQTMRDAARLLKPGGYISVAVPNSDGLPALAWLQPQQWPPHHVSHWRKKDFATLANAVKLRLILVQADVLLGRDLEKIWSLQRRLAVAINHRAATPPTTAIRLLSLLYRKLGLKFFFPRVGSSIQAYFTQLNRTGESRSV
jgi:SAM-dependent methyltransferase